MQRGLISFLTLLTCCTLGLSACGSGGSGELTANQGGTGTGNPVGGGGGASTGHSTATPTEVAHAQSVITITNMERATNGGLPALTENTAMSNVAWIYSKMMYDTNRFSHTDANGNGPGTRVSAAGISWTFVAENIAMGQTSAASVMTAWMNSAGHRANILHTSPTEIGVGLYIAPDGTYWWTQLFRRP